MTTDKRRLKGLYWDRALYLVEGCWPVDEGCANCWARSFTQRFNRSPDVVDGLRKSWSGKILFRENKLELPETVVAPTTWAVWNDLCQERVSNGLIYRSLISMLCVERHTFLVLTKRIERLWSILNQMGIEWTEKRVNHVWFGTSVSRTEDVPSNSRLMHLVVGGCCYPRIFLSVGPMLGAVDLRSLGKAAKSIGLVICECESGPQRRHVKTKHLDDLVEQCLDLKIQLFIKQWDFTGRKVVKTGELPDKYQEFTKLPF